MPVLVKCKWCGKEILSDIRKGRTQKYCSKECYAKGWTGDHPELYKLTNKRCEECGIEYHPRDKDHGKRFCSRVCQRRNGRLKRTVTCSVCGKPFLRDNSSEKFCSHECFWQQDKGDKQSSFNGWITSDGRGYLRFTI
jgi:endogenous inhibitor of DNA gyrase (YacG/DUF329 family)